MKNYRDSEVLIVMQHQEKGTLMDPNFHPLKKTIEVEYLVATLKHQMKCGFFAKSRKSRFEILNENYKFE